MSLTRRVGDGMTPAHDRATLWRAPVVWWAVLGVIALACEAAVLGQWVAAGNIHPAPRDFDISPTRTIIIWVEQSIIFAFIVASAVYLIRQCRKEQAITFDAAVMIGFGLTFWMTPLLNYNGLGVVTNRAALNVSGWAHYIPGWHGPPGLYTETLLAASGGAYFSLLIWIWGQRLLANTFLRSKPHWGNFRCLLVFLFTGMLVDVVFEFLMVPVSGGYAYLTANQSLSLFGGHWYQLPLIAIIAGAAFLCTPFNFLLHQAGKRGGPVHIFRGVDHLSRRTQTWLRLLAGIGFCALVMFVYKLALNLNVLSALGADPIPADTPGWLWPTHTAPSGISPVSAR